MTTSIISGYDNSNFERKCILSIDIGSTTVRACLYNLSYELLFYEQTQMECICDEELEIYEIEPQTLLNQLKQVVRVVVGKAMLDGGGSVRIVSIGLCCQRNTFITWDELTLEPCHWLISWRHGCGKRACANANASLSLKTLNLLGTTAYSLTGSERFKAAKMLKFVNAMVTHRFMGILSQNTEMRKLLEQNRLAIGCIDTWLFARLSDGKTFVTEPSSISSTGLYDPFLCDYGYSILRHVVGWPSNLHLPTITDTTKIDAMFDLSRLVDQLKMDVEGREVNFGASLGDSQAAVFGAGCHTAGTMCISLGTGTFVDYVTDGPYISSGDTASIYPLIGWKLPDTRPVYLIEGRSNNTSAAVEWALSAELAGDAVTSVDALSALATQTLPDEQLCFVSAFNGIQTPFDDARACTAFVGIHKTTTRAQMLRALLESIAFAVRQIWDAMAAELGVEFSCHVIRCCGGVASNDFICQQITTLLHRPLERVANHRFCASTGAAYLAGLSAGVSTLDSIAEQIRVERTFAPDESEAADALLLRYALWKRAQRRCLDFHADY